MSDSIHLEIVTAAETPIKANIKQLYIPAYLGEAGVLEDHKPYISLLQPGEIFYTDTLDKNYYLYTRGGFMEVRDNNIVIISDFVEKGESLDQDEIDKKLAELDEEIGAAVKLKDGMSEDEIKELPNKLAKALEQQREYKTKRDILLKIESN